MATPLIHVAFLIFSAFFALLASPSIAKGLNVLYSDIPGIVPNLTYNQYTLLMQADCNLVIYDQKKPIWATGTYGRGRDCILTLEKTGELIIQSRSPSTRVIWRSNTKSPVARASYALVLQYDGTLQVYGPSRWELDFKNLLTTSPKQTWLETTDSVLYTGDVAPVGTTILNEKYKLVLQKDCNLVVSDNSNGGILWETGKTDPNHLVDCYVTVDGYGQLYVKYMGGELLWTNGAKYDSGSYVLAIRPDGRLFIYGPSIWSSNLTKSGAVTGEIAMSAKYGAVAAGRIAVIADDFVGSSGEMIAMVTME